MIKTLRELVAKVHFVCLHIYITLLTVVTSSQSIKKWFVLLFSDTLYFPSVPVQYAIQPL